MYLIAPDCDLTRRAQKAAEKAKEQKAKALRAKEKVEEQVDAAIANAVGNRQVRMEAARAAVLGPQLARMLYVQVDEGRVEGGGGRGEGGLEGERGEPERGEAGGGEAGGEGGGEDEGRELLMGELRHLVQSPSISTRQPYTPNRPPSTATGTSTRPPSAATRSPSSFVKWMGTSGPLTRPARPGTAAATSTQHPRRTTCKTCLIETNPNPNSDELPNRAPAELPNRAPAEPSLSEELRGYYFPGMPRWVPPNGPALVRCRPPSAVYAYGLKAALPNPSVESRTISRAISGNISYDGLKAAPPNPSVESSQLPIPGPPHHSTLSSALISAKSEMKLLGLHAQLKHSPLPSNRAYYDALATYSSGGLFTPWSPATASRHASRPSSSRPPSRPPGLAGRDLPRDIPRDIPSRSRSASRQASRPPGGPPGVTGGLHAVPGEAVVQALGEVVVLAVEGTRDSPTLELEMAELEPEMAELEPEMAEAVAAVQIAEIAEVKEIAQIEEIEEIEEIAEVMLMAEAVVKAVVCAAVAVHVAESERRA